MIDDRRVEVAARDALGGRLETEEAMREHAGRREPEDQCQHERECRREQEALADELDRRERVLERRLEEHDCVVAERDGDIPVVVSALDDSPALDRAARQCRASDPVGGDVARVRVRESASDDERRLVLREDVECDHAGVRHRSEVVDPVLPEQPVVGQRSRSRVASGSSWSRRASTRRFSSDGHDDHVRGPERAGDDPDEDEHDADPDSAGQRHGATPT